MQRIIEVRVGGADAVDDWADGHVSRDEHQPHQGARVEHRLAGARADRPPNHYQRQGERHPGNKEFVRSLYFPAKNKMVHSYVTTYRDFDK